MWARAIWARRRGRLCGTCRPSSGALGAGWADVVKLTWYLMDVSEIQVVRDVRDEFLRPALGDLPNPASTLIQAGGLFRPGYLVEVDAIVALEN